MNEDIFARENLSIWTGNNAEAWLDSHKLIKLRSLLRCERKAEAKSVNKNTFYIIGVSNICPAAR